jgi:hypothetical protein
MALAAAWLAGLAVIGPYTLRHDRVTLEAALAAREFTAPGDLVFVLNMHDRGVGIGAFNPAIVTLAGRRGWNVDFASDDPAAIQAQIEARRRQGARWVVATWWSPPLDPWFTPLLPTVFSRCPKFADRTVNGAAIVAALERSYPVGVRGENFALLRLPPQ